MSKSITMPILMCKLVVSV